MIVYRITKKKYAKNLDGIGAKINGGRWNKKGFPMLYTSNTASLAITEAAVHLDPKTLPDDYVLVYLQLPENVKIQKIRIAQLSPGWDNTEPGHFTKELGTKWLLKNETLSLEVPSAISPEENNILINPNHLQISQIKVIKTILLPAMLRFVKKK